MCVSQGGLLAVGGGLGASDRAGSFWQPSVPPPFKVPGLPPTSPPPSPHLPRPPPSSSLLLLPTSPPLHRYINSNSLAGLTALHYAVFYDHEACLRELLRHAPAITAATTSDSYDLWVSCETLSTPLHFAAIKNNTVAARLLLLEYVSGEREEEEKEEEEKEQEQRGDGEDKRSGEKRTWTVEWGGLCIWL